VITRAGPTSPYATHVACQRRGALASTSDAVRRATTIADRATRFPRIHAPTFRKTPYRYQKITPSQFTYDRLARKTPGQIDDDTPSVKSETAAENGA